MPLLSFVSPCSPGRFPPEVLYAVLALQLLRLPSVGVTYSVVAGGYGLALLGAHELTRPAQTALGSRGALVVTASMAGLGFLGGLLSRTLPLGGVVEARPMGGRVRPRGPAREG